MTEHQEATRPAVEMIAFFLILAIIILFIMAVGLKSNFLASMPVLAAVAKALSVIVGMKSG
ncbi:MAG: hypothetical protein V1678_03110 [Candidatus Aenigmatarchaeota archaeon]